MLCLHSVLLFINIATPTVNVSLLDGSFTANKFFQLKCDVTGSPTALIRWKKIVGPPVEGDYIISNEVFVLIIISVACIQANSWLSTFNLALACHAYVKPSVCVSVCAFVSICVCVCACVGRVTTYHKNSIFALLIGTQDT